MSRKLYATFAVLIVFAMLVTACGAQSTPTPATSGGQPVQTVEVVKTVIVTVPVPAEVSATQPAPAQAAGYGEITARVKARGKVVCGVHTELPGFGYLDANGRNLGFDIDLCRAVAAAVLGDR